MQESKRIFKESPFMAILSYLVVFIIGASFITMLIASFVANSNGVDYNGLITAITSENYMELAEDMKRYSAITQGLANCIAYFVTMILTILFLRKDLYEDFLKLKEKKLYYLVYSLLAIVIFLGITVGLEQIIRNFAPSSENQTVIEFIMQNGGMVPMIIATVIFAPILEELIYRKSIFSILKNYSIPAAYILSIVAFTLPHVITSDYSDMSQWILITIPYFVSALLLAIIYHKSNYNIYVTIAVHIINNLIAVILIFV